MGVGGGGDAISPSQTIATVRLAQRITLLARYLQAPAKRVRSQHFDAAYRNIVGRNKLRAFGHRVAACYFMLRVENRTNAHALANTVAQTWPNGYNIMQHLRLRQKIDHFQI